MNYLQVVQEIVRTPKWSVFGWRQHTNLWSIPHCPPEVRNVLAELGRHFMMGSLSDQERDYLTSSLNGYLRSRGHPDWFASRGDGVH